MPSPILCLCLGVSLTLSACASASVDGPASAPDPPWVALPSELVGTWDWERSSGGIAGNMLTPSSTGTTRAFRCTAESVCEWTTGATVSLRQPIRLTSEQTPFSITPVLVLWMGELPVKTLLAITTLTSERLVIVEMCADCWMHEYRRGSP